MSTDENKALARRAWDEIFNQRNLDFFDAVSVADAIWHEPEREYQGTEELKQVTAGFLEAFPDLNVTVEDVLAEGEQVAVRWTQRGTHQGEMEGLGPPTGRSFELEGITIHRFEGDKIAETWEIRQSEPPAAAWACSRTVASLRRSSAGIMRT